MTIFKEYSNYDGLGLAEFVSKGEISPGQLIEAALEAIERLNPLINAVILKMTDYADQRLKKGLEAGPFKGVPFLLKDIGASVAGYPTTWGSRLFMGWTPAQDSELVKRYEKAGLVIIGKTNAPELGCGSTEPVAYGPTRNPWNTDRTAEGSSGGSAAAVACGMTPMAHGNDGGGSIRMPASACGLVGLKPTRGRNPAGPQNGEWLSGLAADHALTRTVRDCAALLDCTSGPDVGDPYWAPLPERPFLEEVGREPGQLRIAFATEAPTGVEVHEEYKTAVRETARLLEDLGHQVEEATPDYDTAAHDKAFAVILAAHMGYVIGEGAKQLGRRPGPDNLEEFSLAIWEHFDKITAGDILTAEASFNNISRQVGSFFKRYDVWVCPTMTFVVPPIGQGWPIIEDLMEFLIEISAMIDFTSLFNTTGQPAITLPLHWTSDGLPIGVQFAARYGDEATLFRLASQIEQARPWIDKRPPVYA